jgi:hypothetical protein
MTCLDQPAHYVIRIVGSIDQTLIDWFGPVELAHEAGHGGIAVTALSTVVADQAALVGLIRRLHGLGIILLSVKRVEPSPEIRCNDHMANGVKAEQGNGTCLE